MKWLVFIAGIICGVAVILHLTVARKQAVSPMIDVSFDPVAKRLMHCQFHFTSTFACLSAIMMILVGLGIWPGFVAVLYFIAVNNLIQALVLFFIALTSGIPKALLKMPQWIGLIIIAVLLFIGA